MQTRRTLIAMLAASAPFAGLLAACRGGGKQAAITDDDVAMGSPTAPITLIAYASVACPVCAYFNNNVFPDFKKKYIDTGQVRFVGREINAHDPALSIAGFLLARCAGKDKYFEVTDAVYKAQASIEQSGDARGELLRIAKDFGFSEAQFTACVTDPAAIDAQIARSERLAKEHGVRFTPTFVIDGKIVAEKLVTLEELDAIIAAAKAKPAA